MVEEVGQHIKDGCLGQDEFLEEITLSSFKENGLSGKQTLAKIKNPKSSLTSFDFHAFPVAHQGLQPFHIKLQNILKLKRTQKIIKTNFLLLVGLPRNKPYDYKHCLDAP